MGENEEKGGFGRLEVYCIPNEDIMMILYFYRGCYAAFVASHPLLAPVFGYYAECF